VEVKPGTVLMYDEFGGDAFHVTYFLVINLLSKRVEYYLWDGRDDGFAPVTGKEQVEYTPPETSA
jgi:hypothetical protein